VKDVRGWRVVQDDGVGNRAAELREVFDVVPFVVVATLSEEPVGDNLVDVELVKNRVGILGNSFSSVEVREGERENTLLKLAVKTTIS
jgi:hypothetical protein